MEQKHGAHGEVTQAKMERFCCLFLSRYVVVFSQLGDKYYSRKSEAHVKKNLLKQQLYSCVQMFSWDFTHTVHWQVTYTEIIEVLWRIWDAWMPLCQVCAHSSEQLAVCKGSRKTTVAIFTWWGREVSLPVSENYSNKTFMRRPLCDSTTVEVVMSNVNTVNENVIWLMSSRETQIKLK